MQQFGSSCISSSDHVHARVAGSSKNGKANAALGQFGSHCAKLHGVSHVANGAALGKRSDCCCALAHTDWPGVSKATVLLTLL